MLDLVTIATMTVQGFLLLGVSYSDIQYCGGLTLSEPQMPTKVLYHSPPQQDMGEGGE